MRRPEENIKTGLTETGCQKAEGLNISQDPRHSFRGDS